MRIGAIDHPNERSLHTVPTPKLGGLGILGGAVVAGFVFLPGDSESHAILIGAVAIALVGVLDDVFDLPAAVEAARPDRRGGDPGRRPGSPSTNSPSPSSAG